MNPNDPDYNPDHDDSSMEDVYTINTDCEYCGSENASHLIRGWTHSFYLCDDCYKEELNKS